MSAVVHTFRGGRVDSWLASLGASVLAGAGVDWIARRAAGDADWDRLRSRLRNLLLGAAVLFLAAAWLGASGERTTPKSPAKNRELQALRTVATSPGAATGSTMERKMR